MSKKILVVDDEPVLVQMLKSRFEANQYAVTTASDGDEAFKQLESESPDVIVLDIMMPKMDGYTFFKKLKGMYPDHASRVIVLTAKDQLQDLFAREGVSDYITKPFRAEELLAKIKERLR